MKPVQVTARFDPDGKATPLSFTWLGQTYPVNAIGRRWSDEEGQHILVMVPGEQVFELIFAPADARWYLRQPGKNQMVA
jgi:hypothetical protein